MKPTVLVHQQTKSSWVSCQSIVANLLASYQNVIDSSQLKSVALTTEMNRFQTLALARKIVAMDPERLVFIDHKPHPHDLIQCLDQVLEGKPLPELIFHAFGDFTLHPNEWLGIETELKKTPTLLIAASGKQRRLLDSFVSDPQKNMATLPFPLDTDHFSYDETLRHSFRKELGIPDDEFVFVYTGRLSIQKNVLDLIATYQNFFENFNSRCHMLFAGPMDDIGIPFLGKYVAPGGFYFHWNSQISKLPSEAKEKFHYLGNLDHEKLRALYCAGDGFISLSTHNDEDYGMSPAEALCCGLPCVLSDWGGYQSFRQMAGDHCALVPVDIQDKKVSPQLVIALKKMMKLSQSPLDSDKRSELSKQMIGELSIETTSQKIKRLLDKKPDLFSGFNNHFGKLGSAWSLNRHAPFLDDNGHYSNFYRELYSVYATEDSL